MPPDGGEAAGTSHVLLASWWEQAGIEEHTQTIVTKPGVKLSSSPSKAWERAPRMCSSTAHHQRVMVVGQYTTLIYMLCT